MGPMGITVPSPDRADGSHSPIASATCVRAHTHRTPLFAEIGDGPACPRLPPSSPPARRWCLSFSQDDIAEEEIAEANEEYLRRLRETKSRTDDEINDDAAGLARAEFAAKAKAAHEAEQKKVRGTESM